MLLYRNCRKQSLQKGEMGDMKPIMSYLESGRITSEVSSVRKWSSVIIDFTDDSGADDSTSFDVKNITSEEGVSELSELFDTFCKECGIKTPVVNGIFITASAGTYEKLCAI